MGYWLGLRTFWPRLDRLIGAGKQLGTFGIVFCRWDRDGHKCQGGGCRDRGDDCSTSTSQ
jgi:hypothetical protein